MKTSILRIDFSIVSITSSPCLVLLLRHSDEYIQTEMLLAYIENIILPKYCIFISVKYNFYPHRQQQIYQINCNLLSHLCHSTFVSINLIIYSQNLVEQNHYIIKYIRKAVACMPKCMVPDMQSQVGASSGTLDNTMSTPTKCQIIGL